MTSDKYAMSEKILQDVSSVLEKNTNLNEFEIVPMPSSQNKSPVLSAGNCLALESWCTKYLYCYVYDIIMNLRKQKKKFIYDDSLIKQLNCALLLNPDVMTFWNMRRQFVEKNFISIDNELKFTRLVLSRKHKCNEAFGYRRWLITRSNDEMSIQTLNRELEVSRICADRSACNCHAWTHRIWAIQQYLSCSTETTTTHFNLLLTELQFSESWTCSHISDFSGFHYRQFLLDTVRCKKSILCDDDYLTSNFSLKGLENLNNFLCVNDEEKMDMNNLSKSNILYHLYNYKPYISDESYENRIVFLTMLLVYELTYLQQLKETFGCHESIYCHRRYVVHTLFGLDREFNAKTHVGLDLNELYAQQQSTGNIIKSLDSDSLVDSPKKTKHECDFERLLRAVVNNERRNVTDTKYLKWCRFILNVPMS